jgi:ABC-2 type transport system permease protein
MHVFILEFKKLASYRVDFWMRMVFSALARVLLSYYLWDAVFKELGVATLGGYSFAGMVYYFVIASLVSNVVLAGIDFFSSEVYDGTLTRYLLYPVSFFLYKFMVGAAYAVLALSQVLLGLFVVSLLVDTPHDVTITWKSVTLGLCATLCAAYLYRIVQGIVELLSFWAENVFGLMVAMYFIINFFGGGLIPLSLFPQWSQDILAFTPFPYMIGFPVQIIVGKIGFIDALPGFCTMIAWSVGLSLFITTVWKRGLRRYSGVGI